jgi:4-amino-4-deoxyprephenate dehydrogenase
VSRPLRFARSVVVGGSGAVGELLVRTLLAGDDAGVVTVVDRRSEAVASGAASRVDDICAPSRETLGCIEAADLVILAVPEPVAVQAIGPLLEHMRPGALLVDTLSVKSRFAAALPALDLGRVEVLGINPMFAPGLGFAGRSVVAVPYAAGMQAEQFLGLIEAEGSEVTRLDAEQHDRVCAALQVATHAAVLTFGMALRAAGYDVAAAEKIAPPPHRTLLALLARILGADSEVYRDIQEANPFAAEMRGRIIAAQHELEAIVATDDPERFRQLFADLQALFPMGCQDYGRLCARLFEVDPRG